MRHRARRRRLGRGLLGAWVACLPFGVASAEPSGDDAPAWPMSARADLHDTLDSVGLALDLSYTGDWIANTRGGEARKNTYLGTVDLTLSWDTGVALEHDLGTLFVYGIWIHGGQPSQFVGDIQATDNIEAQDAVRVFEAWWQHTLFDGRASILAGLYDVNSEFYAIDSAEIFLNGSFGMGGEVGNTGLSGPSTFPVSGLGARFKTEPVRGLEFQVAAVEGAPGDPRRPTATSLDIEDDEGAFVIAQLAYHRHETPADDERQDIARPSQRRRVGRVWAERPKWARVAVGTWLYTARQPHVSRTDAMGDPIRARGHPGLYMTVDYEADHLVPEQKTEVSAFLQLGWADGDVGPFEGYTAGGLTFEGLLPWRRDDESGVAVAAAYLGDASRDAARSNGREPGVAEIVIEGTYRAHLTDWFSLQGDLQYVVNPGGVRDRPDALVLGLRWVLAL